MSIQFDYQTRTLTLGVRDLCGPEWSGGSLNLLPLSGARNELGQALHEAHQTRQEKLHPGYRKEQTIRFEIKCKDYSVLIQGRVDGVYERNRQTIIEEIKSVLSLQEEFRREDLPESYFLQLKIYLYLWSQVHEIKDVVGSLVVISCEDQEMAVVEVASDPETIHHFIQEQLERIILESEKSCRRKAEQASQEGTIHFPFSQMRRHQDTMIEVIGSTLQSSPASPRICANRHRKDRGSALWQLAICSQKWSLHFLSHLKDHPAKNRGGHLEASDQQVHFNRPDRRRILRSV